MSYSVLYYETERGRQPVREYLDRVGRSSRASELASIQRDIDLLVEFGAALPSFGNIAKPIVGAAGLYQLTSGRHRIAYGVVRSEFVLLHAWLKQGRRSPRDIERAKRRFRTWKARGVDDTS